MRALLSWLIRLHGVVRLSPPRVIVPSISYRGRKFRLELLLLEGSFWCPSIVTTKVGSTRILCMQPERSIADACPTIARQQQAPRELMSGQQKLPPLLFTPLRFHSTN